MCIRDSLETTFRTETETDLFGEQAVLCGGPLQRPLCGHAAEGTGAFILPRLLSESGLYPRTAVGPYLGL